MNKTAQQVHIRSNQKSQYEQPISPQNNRHLELIIRGFCGMAFGEIDETDEDGFEDTVGMLIHDHFRKVEMDERQRDDAVCWWIERAMSWYF